MYHNKEKIHFVGIGGIGMSAIAKILLKMGYQVSGSDLEENHLTKALAKEGAKIYLNHQARHVRGATKMVYSSCINNKNPEIQQAKKDNIPIIHRAKILAQLTKNRRNIIITGAHGKTTTTALTSLIFKKARLEPLFLIGGVLKNINSNAYCGEGAHAVIEADESDGSFLQFAPQIGILTNIDCEHMEYYKTMDNLKRANIKFIKRIKRNGILIYNHDDPISKKLVRRAKNIKIISVGMSRSADVFAKNIVQVKQTIAFDVYQAKKNMGRFKLNMPGEHNIMNAMMAIVAAIEEGIGIHLIQKALQSYAGTQRRFDIVYEDRTKILMHDYAHHPREIQALIKSIRISYAKSKIIVVFQPHRFSRTRHLLKDFVMSLKLANQVILTDIYAASEKPISGVTIEKLYSELAKKHSKTEILPKGKIAKEVTKLFRGNVIVLILGAGDIEKVAYEIKNLIKK